MWADRILKSAMTRQLLDSGLASEKDPERISAGWREWLASDDGWFSILLGEILGRTR